MSSPLTAIRLRGVRQNNLKGFDLELPLGKLIVVTGLSGAGKSSLVFETLHAEGQRRYVETFSPYVRQFLEMMDRPRVDDIENIRPSIAIEQGNTVRTSRSTVGTMTELCDFMKVWFCHRSQLTDPVTGAVIEDDNPATVWRKLRASHTGRDVLLGFAVHRPKNFSWTEIVENLRGQGFTRLLVNGRILRLDEWNPQEAAEIARIDVVQDRLRLDEGARGRFLDSAAACMHFGQGELRLFSPGGKHLASYSKGLHDPVTGRRFQPPTPALFSFHSPVGACPNCRGFGRVIEIDYRLVIPDHSKSLRDGAIRPFQGAVYSASNRDLLRACRRLKIPVTKPWRDLTETEQRLVIDGEPGYGEGGKEWPQAWYGVRRFFEWLEGTTYKMHVRVFLSKYRAYVTCPECLGARLQPEALHWRWHRYSLPDLYRMPIDRLLRILEGGEETNTGNRQLDIAIHSILTRLRYLCAVGLGYLTLDRASRTLSGGETERVNLTACLGSSLVDTLFVLDEPSIGLHARDLHRLIETLRRLVAQGNTVVVVEHDESVMRAADLILEVGPLPGAGGGRVVYLGSPAALVRSRKAGSKNESITADYLRGAATIPPPADRRPVPRDPGVHAHLHLRGVRKHNLDNLDLRIPLHRFVALSGVSGAGKSTLLNNAIYQGLLARSGRAVEDPATFDALDLDDPYSEILLVDQSPVSRTPRSNPALYIDAWEPIRKRYAQTDAARSGGLTAAQFSFNSGDGRCPNCQGLGRERVEMQFMADVFVPCPVCDGKRFRSEILEIRYNGLSVSELLERTVDEAVVFFADDAAIRHRLSALVDVGLGYLPLGQPLNTLSGGESQRLKLVKYLGKLGGESDHAILLLDEPTTGLHRHDVKDLLRLLQGLVTAGHSLVIIEHHTDVLAAADWVIELGPEAGDRGGRVVFAGTPVALARAGTATSPYLEDLRPDSARVADRPVPDGAGPKARAARPQRRRRRAELRVQGAREHNLCNIDVAIPLRQLTVVTGVSGSGKSSLAFDIIFAEGQRRFMESMSAWARQYVEQLPRPAIDHLDGIPPTVAIEQRVTAGTSKSTVATITEVAQYLRLLYARLGVPHNPETGEELVALDEATLARHLHTRIRRELRSPSAIVHLCSPVVRGRKGHHQPLADWAAARGYRRMRVDGRFVELDHFRKLDRYREHDIELVVASFTRNGRNTRIQFREDAKPFTASTLQETVRAALDRGKETCLLASSNASILARYSTRRANPETGESLPELDPKHFSWHSPKGWCPVCHGHGRVFEWMLNDEEYGELRAAEARAGEACPECLGGRLNRFSRAVRVPLEDGRRIALPELLRFTPAGVLEQIGRIRVDARGSAILDELRPEINERLMFMNRVGLDYLGLDRATATLSGGEAQRIRLAAQLGSNLSGVLYVLDEPSIGLHARDNERLLASLDALKAKGNTLLVVEHDADTIRRADHLIELGPAAGRHGGQLIYNGAPKQLLGRSTRPGSQQANASRRKDHPHRSATARYLRDGIPHPRRGSRRPLPAPWNPRSRRAGHAWVILQGAALRNLKGIDLHLPKGRLIGVCGISGAGKSTLVRDLLQVAVREAADRGTPRLSGAACRERFPDSKGVRLPFRFLRHADTFHKVIEVDQTPIGKTPRSTPATYIGIFDEIRRFFAALPEARMLGLEPGAFSFNTPGGRCESCKGAGRIKLEMSFMPDTYVACDACGGTRYGPQLEDIRWKSKNIADILAMTFEEAVAFFDFHSTLCAMLELMIETGLGYLTLGQSSPSLSGGEAQRLKLVSELVKGLPSAEHRRRGKAPRNFYLLEEPTIGLHLSDCERLIDLLHRLVDEGHTVAVIEHHCDILAEADYLVEIGPEGGDRGGELLYQGTPEGILEVPNSPTAPFLRNVLRGREREASARDGRMRASR